MNQIYLTKMILNPRCPQVRRDIGNPQDLHRTISNAFPELAAVDGAPREKYNILHRLDIDRRRGSASLLIQSTEEPAWGHLDPDYAIERETRTIDEQYAAIKDGRKLMFRLHANPSKRDKSKFDSAKPKQRKRFALHKDEDRIDWLQRKGERNGFRLTEIRVSAEKPVTNVTSVGQSLLSFRKHKGSPVVNIGSVVFEGVLEVTDSERFLKDALVKGIGPGKAYGFGLLSIAPLRAANAGVNGRSDSDY